ncbi:MAG TPA: amidohydrolase family protein [Candidatus Binataceae bacterium]|nr:amidohydrolase family protein [Candidatus Binataceae bacterium]
MSSQASSHGLRRSAVRERLGYPIIDCDGHTVEHLPAVLDYLRDLGGPDMVARLVNGGADYYNRGLWGQLAPEERHRRHLMRPPWWAVPAKNTLDRATATLPKLLHERLDEIGIDFTVLFPSQRPSEIDEAELRVAACRAYNRFHADLFRPYQDRMTPAAVIPMHTPREAIDELEYAVRELGFKVVLMPTYARRRADASDSHRLANPVEFHLDFFAIDSDYDYDPVWAKCVELKVVPAFHSAGMGWGSRRSSNYMYNHIGHFGSAAEGLCKALFMGGVTRRFPELRFAFLECGVAWAASLYSDLVGHWKKRNAEVIRQYDPAALDRALFADLFRRYGGPLVLGARAGENSAAENPGSIDEWAACGIRKAEDIRKLFVDAFYFGCEADDRMNAVAFNPALLPFGARLGAVFSSDIGHWDVPDMTKVVDEAYELVEEGVVSAQNFRDFVFTNPLRMWTALNKNFFKGTVIESHLDRPADRADTAAG